MHTDDPLRAEESKQMSDDEIDKGAAEEEAAGADLAALQATEPAFPVAGIGASAGGLEALRGFLEGMPADSGVAYVVVVHLSPEHQSHMAELLQPHTRMPVTQVTDLVKMEPNHVYVIPPGRNLSSIDTHLRLSPLEQARRERAPVDHFFRTLARTHDSKAIGIVLLGNGSDGAVGLKAIKEAGGLILAQEPTEAAFDGMPQSAIATGIVDDVLPVSELAGRLLTFVSTQPSIVIPDEVEVRGAGARRAAVEEREEGRLLQKIFARLRTITGHDFSRYKPGTVGRRIARRMQLHGITTLEEYLELLRAEPDEGHALFKDLLIVVTNFFREPETFEALREKVVRRLFEGKGPDDEVRVWVPGCATGEEAYSLAIVLLEHASRLEEAPSIQIFATDLSREALAVAREGLYPEAIATDVSPDRRHRFFVRTDGAYRVRQDVRETVLFAPHSLLKDPPFSHVDLISCRNLLIYLQRDVQRQVLELFHYALQPGGTLFLGSSERVDEHDLFRALESGHSIYRRQQVSASMARLPFLPLAAADEGPVRRAEDTRPQGQNVANYGALHQQAAERYAPPSVLVDENHRIVHVSQRAGNYLQLPGGQLTDNVLQLAREELQTELATMLYRAFHQYSGSRSQPLTVRREGRARAVSLYVEPLEERGQRFALVCFLESDRGDAQRVAGSGEERDEVVRQLEEELAATKQELRAAVEEFESSKEEMKASNEELQSMNEELVTANEENKNKVVELSQLTADLQNLLAATDIATVFLDRELRIQRFTSAASVLFNIRHSDRGRPLAHLAHRLVSYDGLMDDAEAVLRTLSPVEREVGDGDGRHYFLRILPYRTADERIDGVVVTLVDITSLREAEQALARTRERYRLLVEGTQEYAMFTMDETARIDSWNRGARRILGYDEEEILGQPGAVIFTPEDRQSGAVERELRVARETGHAIDERWHIRKDGSRFWGSGVVTSLWDGGVLRGYAKVMRDNTARKEAEETLRESEARLRGIFEIVTVGIIFIDESGTIVEANDTFLRDVGYSRSELEAGELSWQEPTPPEWKEVSREQMRQVHETGRIGPYEKEYYRKDGSRSWFLFAGVQLAGGSAVEFVIDISEQKAAEQALRESRQELQELADKLEDLVEERTEQVRLLASELVASEQKVRHRVARTLHDDLQQMLYAAEMQLQFLREDLGDEAQDDLEEMVKLVADSLRVTRRLTVDLSPPVLKGEGLPEALEWLANHMREVHSLQVRVEVGDHPRLRLEEQRILLFQIVRELLFNVVKHAGVREAQVTVRKAEGGIVVTVSDGGRGFDVESVTLEENGGFGLHNVRERLDLFGGRMEIDSQPGQGTRVTLFLPNAGPDVQTNEKRSNQG